MSEKRKESQGQEEVKESVVDDGEVAKEEVESRDEGWGGGQEARDFVEETDVDGGTVRKST